LEPKTAGLHKIQQIMKIQQPTHLFRTSTLIISCSGAFDQWNILLPPAKYDANLTTSSLISLSPGNVPPPGPPNILGAFLQFQRLVLNGNLTGAFPLKHSEGFSPARVGKVII
jgi:hypothetical protein